MTNRERGFLLLGSSLGTEDRRPLSDRELTRIAQRARALPWDDEDRELTEKDLTALGYSPEEADRILRLLSDGALLEYYVHRGLRAGCRPLTRVSPGYPLILRRRLGLAAPGCLWYRGDLAALEMPRIALVGSRDLADANRTFAQAVGRAAAEQGFALVSGNARGADRAAQEACLAAGGWVISVVADRLDRQWMGERLLYLSEDGYDREFSAQRAIHRNRVIHALGLGTFVAQAAWNRGGTWSGTAANLRGRWSPVFCFADGSRAAEALIDMGARAVFPENLRNIRQLLQIESISNDQ